MSVGVTVTDAGLCKTYQETEHCLLLLYSISIN